MERRTALVAGLATLALHLVGNAHYGFFRDELYFIICGQHPQFGYVDQPPLVPLLAAGSQLFGHSLFALRLIPAVLAGLTAYVTCVLAAELGGGRFAQALAAVCVALAPVLASFGVLMYPDTLQIALWPLIALVVLRVTRGADPRWWLAVGTLTGIAFQAKYSIVFFALALVAALVLTAQRRVLATRYAIFGAAIAVVIALPNVAWQMREGFPMLELLRNDQLGKNVVLSPLAFVLSDVKILNPLLSLVWIAGVIWSLTQRRVRWIGLTALFVLALMIAMHGKDYYPVAVFPMLFAAGGVAIEDWTSRVRIVRPVALVLAVAAGMALLPLGMPVLPETLFVRYARAIGVVKAQPSEHHAMADLPQLYADMHGWPQLAATVARVYHALPPAEQRIAVIKTPNYGEASALIFFGERYGLPQVVSGHNQFWLWGYHGGANVVLIDVNGDCGAAQHIFAHARVAATFTAPWVMPYENDMPIAVCRDPRVPLATLWPSFKNYN